MGQLSSMAGGPCSRCGSTKQPVASCTMSLCRSSCRSCSKAWHCRDTCLYRECAAGAAAAEGRWEGRQDKGRKLHETDGQLSKVMRGKDHIICLVCGGRGHTEKRCPTLTFL